MGHKTNLFVVYAPLIFCMTLLVGYRTGQRSSASLIPQADALKISPPASGPSKINGLSSSLFRENILQVRRKQEQSVQQQQQPINNVGSNEQQVVQQQRQAGVVQSTQQQQNVNDLTFAHGDSQQSDFSANTRATYGSVQGTPGIDLPNYNSIPNTRFSCDGVPFEPGMYADESTGCQVYHLCYQGRRESFLCGMGTVFNQAILNCDFWHSVDCSRSSLYYGVNADFGKSSPEPGANNIQSFSQTSLSQQSVLPVVTVQHQVVKNYQESSLIVPDGPNFVSNERVLESRQMSSGGKISPSRQYTSPGFAPINRLSGTASADIISPGRKAARLNRLTNGITSAESSTIRSLTTQASSTKSRSNNSSNANVRSRVGQNQLVGEEPPRSFIGPEFNSISSFNLKEDSSFKATKDQSLTQSEEPVWKPYFRNKGKTSSGKASTQSEGSPVPPAPVSHIINGTSRGESASSSASTASDGQISSSERPNPRLPSTLAQPDQEPTFSSIESSQPSSTNEIPKIPNSSAPPATEPPTSIANEPSTETSPSVSVESDVSTALSTTTPRPDEGATTTSTLSSESNTGLPTSNEAPAPTTTTTSAPTGRETSTQEDEDYSRPATTTAIDQTTTKSLGESSGVTKTTTTSPSTESETTAQPGTSTTVDQESDDTTSQAETGKKAKREGTVAGVEYAIRADDRKFENSSSVVYADGRQS